MRENALLPMEDDNDSNDGEHGEKNRFKGP